MTMESKGFDTIVDATGGATGCRRPSFVLDVVQAYLIVTASLTVLVRNVGVSSSGALLLVAAWTVGTIVAALGRPLVNRLRRRISLGTELPCPAGASEFTGSEQ